MNFYDVLNKAKEEKYAIPQFNINNLEWAKYILEECEKEKSPVFIGVSTGAAKYMGGYNTVVNMVRGLQKDLNITVPVMIHLDHASTIDACTSAINAGFDSIMIDASSNPLEENIRITNEVISYNKDKLYEAEIGQIGGTEDDMTTFAFYTNVEEAEYFVSKTNVDMLAPALGSVHGIYKGEPNINFEVMNSIRNKTNKPLVLHGGSGLSDEILKKAVSCGIVKINFNTELQLAWHKSVVEFINNNKEAYDPRKVISSGEKALKEVVSKYISVLGSKNKG